MSMSRMTIRTAAIVLLSVSFLAAQSRSGHNLPYIESSKANLVQAKTPAKITAIRAQLFYDATGTFSEDILAREDFALWNTIIGEGSAGAPSTSTLVTVEVSGRHLPVGTVKIEITATGDKGRLIQRKVIGVDIYDARTKFFAPLWLYDTGCQPIKISARLLGARSTPMTRTIPFACGE